MPKIDNVKIMVCIVALALCDFLSQANAQTSEASNSNNNVGGMSHGIAAPVAPRPNNEKLKGITVYADERPDLTPDQIKIGFALDTHDRLHALAMIKQTHDSVDFAVWKDTPATPLVVAASVADTEMIAAILAKGVAVDSALPVFGGAGQTALIAAVSNTEYAYQSRSWTPPAERFLETIRFLLKSGANPNARTSYGWSPLSKALELRPRDSSDEKIKLAIIKSLLDGGANLGLTVPILGDSSSDTEIYNLLFERI